MRMKKIVENRTLKSAADEFIAFKRAQKIRERTLHDYQKYINPFVEQSSNSMDIDVLKREILEYFANIPATSPARYNHPYQYLHALFAWCAKQDYLPYNPFDKLELKKLKDEGNIKPATIADIQSLLSLSGQAEPLGRQKRGAKVPGSLPHRPGSRLLLKGFSACP